MNRRSFLGRLVAGAAAVLGAGMVAPKAEAAEGVPFSPSAATKIAETESGYQMVLANRGPVGSGFHIGPLPMPKEFTLVPNTFDHADLVQGYIDRGEVIPSGEYTISRPLMLRSGGIVRGMGPSTVLRQSSGESVVVHMEEGGGNMTVRDVRVEAVSMRAEGYIAGDALTSRGVDIWNAGYNRGHAIAEARAESRLSLGLPIRRGETG